MTTKSLLLTEFGGSVSADVDAPADDVFALPKRQIALFLRHLWATDRTVGTLRVNWDVPQAGIYRFVLSGKRGGDRVETMGSFDLEARD